MKMRGRPRAPSAFSLLELLVVIAIIVLLAALVIPNFTSLGAAQNLRGALNGLAAAIGNARKIAIASDRAVEFRICSDLTGSNFTGYQVMTFDQFGLTTAQAQPLQRLPAAFTFAKDSRSNFLSSPPYAVASSKMSTGGTINYYAFHFLPDGSTDLPSPPNSAPNWFLTITYQTAASASSHSPTLASVAIDPVTGVVTTYQP